MDLVDVFKNQVRHTPNIKDYPDDVIRVFVGVDGPRKLASEVLKYSILKNTSRRVVFFDLENIHLSDVLTEAEMQEEEVSKAMYTGFSLYRWAIPLLCGNRGKAIYMDADIFNYSDIGELWDMDTQGHTQLQVTKYSSVMLLDCAKADWCFADICRKIVTNRKKYYRKFMFSNKGVCTGSNRGQLHRSWNDLDVFREDTKMIHYTKVPRQPWSYLSHPYGQHYYDLMNECLELGILTDADISESIQQKGCHKDIRKRLATPSTLKVEESI